MHCNIFFSRLDGFLSSVVRLAIEDSAIGINPGMIKNLANEVLKRCMLCLRDYGGLLEHSIYYKYIFFALVFAIIKIRHITDMFILGIIYFI